MAYQRGGGYGNRNNGGGGYRGRSNGNSRGGYGGGQQTQRRSYGNNGGRRGGNDDGPCTDKQAAVLEKYGYNPNVSFSEAVRIIDELAANNWQRPGRGGQRRAPQGGGRQQQGRGPQRSGDNICTDKQAAVLEKYGYDPNVSFDEANAIIDELAANGWQRPDGDGGYDDGEGDGYDTY